MFYDLPPRNWSLKMISENFRDWCFQIAVDADRKQEREQADRDQREKELRSDI